MGLTKHVLFSVHSELDIFKRSTRVRPTSILTRDSRYAKRVSAIVAYRRLSVCPPVTLLYRVKTTQKRS